MGKERRMMRAAPALLGVAALAALGGCGVHARGAHGYGMHGAHGEETMEEFFALADSDGDGKLSAEEIFAARDAFARRRIDRAIERHDADGDGLLGPDEAAAWRDSRMHHGKHR